jgi:hypothetical protein
LLYEYTVTAKSKEKNYPDSSNSDKKVLRPNQLEANEHVSLLLNSEFGKKASRRQSGSAKQFVGSTNTLDDLDRSIIPCPDGFLNNVYPMVNIVVSEPVEEENGRYSICISKKDGQKLKTLKRENESSLFEGNLRPDLTLLFNNKERAYLWKSYIEKNNLINSSNGSSDSITNADGGIKRSSFSDIQNSNNDRTASYDINSGSHSASPQDLTSSVSSSSLIVNQNKLSDESESFLNRKVNKKISSFLIIPSSGLDSALIEKLKIEIAVVCNSNSSNI